MCKSFADCWWLCLELQQRSCSLFCKTKTLSSFCLWSLGKKRFWLSGRDTKSAKRMWAAAPPWRLAARAHNLHVYNSSLRVWDEASWSRQPSTPETLDRSASCLNVNEWMQKIWTVGLICIIHGVWRLTEASVTTLSRFCLRPSNWSTERRACQNFFWKIPAHAPWCRPPGAFHL